MGIRPPGKDLFMRSPSHTNTTVDPERPRVAGRWLRRSLVVGSLVATSLVVAACGSDAKVTVLNTEKIERAIEHSSLSQRQKHVVVSCPSGVHQKKGLMFSCTAVGRQSRTSFVVKQLDDAGQVHYQAQ
jgi:hypothetical protein